MQELPGYRLTHTYSGLKVFDVCLDAFAVFGAKEDIPFSVYEKLVWQEEGELGHLAGMYSRVIRHRRQQQGLLEEDPEPTLNPRQEVAEEDSEDDE